VNGTDGKYAMPPSDQNHKHIDSSTVIMHRPMCGL